MTLLDRFFSYYVQHPTWGSLHVVLDDGNVEDSAVNVSLKHAREHGDDEGAVLAEALLAMSWRQRARLYFLQREWP